MTDRITPEKRSWNMSRIKGKDTKIEVQVRSWLFSRGFRFRKNDRRTIKDIQGHRILFCRNTRLLFLLADVSAADMKE